MRLDADVRRCVVFLGQLADPDNDETFRAAGTGFFIEHEQVRYLATAQHIAGGFGDSPFYVRINRHDGSSDSMYCDPLSDVDGTWISHPDPDVDLAIVPFHYSESTGLDLLTMSSTLLLSDEEARTMGINVGDLCHAIGLFRLLQGSKRNVPIVHTGNIALMPGEELIPVDDWLCPNQGKRRHVSAYLVELQNLKGLSGAPVIVRPTRRVIAQSFSRGQLKRPKPGPPVYASAYDDDVYLLGVWSASWDAPPDEVASAAYGTEARVPVGLGTVVPAGRLVELLRLPIVIARRDAEFARLRAQVEPKIY